MRILVTGAAGLLGRTVAPVLVQRGHEVVQADVDVPPAIDGARAVPGDVTDPDEMRAAAEGCDAIVHAAAWHDAHRERRTDRDYFEVNVRGTFNVLEAAIASGTKTIVFASSVNVHRNWERLYTSTKRCGEELCRNVHREKGLRVALMRYWAFSPHPAELEGLLEYGAGLLWISVSAADVAIATALATEGDDYQCEIFPVAAEVPFDEDDCARYTNDPAALIEEKFPGSRDLLARNDFQYPRAIYPNAIQATAGKLGYIPRYNFSEFLAELSEAPGRD